MELAPHIRRIGNDIIAVHLIETDEGITVIDAGLAGHWKDFTAELAAMGRIARRREGGRADPRRFRPRRLRRAAAAGGAACRCTSTRRMPREPRGRSRPRPAGSTCTSEPTVGFFWYSLRKGGLRTTRADRGRRGARRRDPAAAGRAADHRSPGSLAGKRRACTFRSPGRCSSGDALTTRHVLTGEVAPAAGALHRRPGCRGPITRCDRRPRRGLGDPGARSAVAREPPGARRRDPRARLSLARDLVVHNCGDRPRHAGLRHPPRRVAQDPRSCAHRQTPPLPRLVWTDSTRRPMSVFHPDLRAGRFIPKLSFGPRSTRLLADAGSEATASPSRASRRRSSSCRVPMARPTWCCGCSGRTA